MHASAGRVDAVGVEGEQGYDALEGESLEEVKLGGCVDEDGDVVQLGVVNLVHFQVELG